MLFSLKHELGIKNFLHVAKISIALPICNAESERVFVFMACFLEKMPIIKKRYLGRYPTLKIRHGL